MHSVFGGVWKMEARRGEGVEDGVCMLGALEGQEGRRGEGVGCKSDLLDPRSLPLLGRQAGRTGPFAPLPLETLSRGLSDDRMKASWGGACRQVAREHEDGPPRSKPIKGATGGTSGFLPIAGRS